MQLSANEIYDDRVINGHPENFTGVELAGVRFTGDVGDDDEKVVVVDNIEQEFYSCYLRHKDGRALSCADIAAFKDASEYGQKLATKYGWTFHSEVKGH
jgi:hypothetical protein